MASYLNVLIQAAEPANYKLNYDEHYMISVPFATTTTPGVASFNSDYFKVVNGVVSLSDEYAGNLNNILDDIANLQEGKVNKIDPEDAGIFAYVVRKVMGQVIDYAIEISEDADANTIAMRYTNGRLKVGDGVDNADAVNKAQLTAATTDIPKSALASDVRTSLGKADTAYQKPGTGIPETDLSSNVRTKLNKAISRVGITDADWQALPVADRDVNTCYFVGPYGTSPNQYFVEWMYFVDTNDQGHWEALGSTLAVDLSNYFTKSEVNALLAGKANVDGVYSGMSVGHANTADEANSLSTSLGVTDETPTAMQPVGGSSDVTTTYQKLNKLVGCKVVKNQLALSKQTQTLNGVTFTNNGDGSYTLTGTASQSTFFYITNTMSFGSNHKVLFGFVNIPSAITGVTLREDYSFVSTGTMIVGTLTGSAVFIIRVQEGTEFPQAGSKVFPVISDLTLRYGNNDVVNAIIGNDSSKYVEKLLAFDPNILVDTAYDTGSFSMCKSATLRTVDYNQWDEQWEVGGINSNGQPNAQTDCIRAKNYIPVLPNRQYEFFSTNGSPTANYGWGYFYDKDKNFISAIAQGNRLYASTFTTPANARFIRFDMTVNYGTTYNHDICIFLYWDGSRIGYEPYSAHPYPLPNKDLNGILTVKNGKVVADGDELYPSGEGNATRYAEVDLGTLNWDYLPTESQFSPLFYVNLPLAKRAADTPNASCSKYSVVKRWVGIFVDKTLTFDWTGSQVQVQVKDSAYSDAATFKTAMSGVKLIYELATPTALTASTFTSTFYGDDFGTMWFLDEDGNVIDGLQGNEIFYKANVAGFAESLYSEADGDPDYFEAAGDVPTDIANYLKGLTGYDATKTQTLKNVTGTLTWVDDA